MRAFRIRRVRPYTGLAFWRWECTLCHPPAEGGRFGPDALDKIIRISMPRHFRVRKYHHKYVLETRGRSL